MPLETTRRGFLKSTALAGAGLLAGAEGIAGRPARAQDRSPNERLNVGVIGVGGRGRADLEGVSSQNLVALCDVDERNLAMAAARFPRADLYQDWRKMLERKDLDAVVVATPDHVHAFASVAALQLGKHVYCEKPLTHSVYEARVVSKLAAARPKLATQMGNQGHSGDNMRRLVEIVQSGAIGPVREVHAWTNRPIWPQGIHRPTDSVEIPAQLSWDLWLGPAPQRPYHPAYVPFKWRGWWDFGTGALGDMACHMMDAAYWSLKLGQPASVWAEGPAPDPDCAPAWETIRYQFPEREGLPPLRLTWYDGRKASEAEIAAAAKSAGNSRDFRAPGEPNLPPKELFDGLKLPEGEKLPDSGSVFVGDKGKVMVWNAAEKFALFPESQFAGYVPPAPTIPNSPGHHEEWIRACKTGSPTGSNFAYATALTGMVLLGNVAYRLGKKLEWDGAKMQAINCPEAEPLLRPVYRSGWSLE